MDERMSLEHWWNDIAKGKTEYSGKTPVPLYLPQISRGLAYSPTCFPTMPWVTEVFVK